MITLSGFDITSVVRRVEELPPSDRYVLPNWKSDANNHRATAWAYLQRADGGDEVYLDGQKFIMPRPPEHNDWIQTFSGMPFDMRNFDPDNILIEDIAHAGALTCRFGGHCKKFYSVAQHAVLVSRRLPGHLKFAAIMHDSTESYLHDVTTPLKRMLPEYKKKELELQRVIEKKFGFAMDAFEDPVLKDVDFRMCVTEARDLFNRNMLKHWSRLFKKYEPYEERIEPWPPEEAEEMFLTEFKYLKS